MSRQRRPSHMDFIPKNIRIKIRNYIYRAILTYIPSLEKNKTIGLSFLFLFMAFALDRITGYQINLSFLYLLPILFITQAGKLPGGLLAALVVSLTRQLADHLSGLTYPQAYYYYINIVSKFLTYATFTFIIDLLFTQYSTARDSSLTDDLTQIPNRKYFFERASRELIFKENYKSCFNLLLIDIDNFKSINNNLGHQAGDKLLQNVASEIRNNTRSTDIIARLGGDEFVVVFIGVSNEIVAKLTKKLHTKLNELFKNEYPGITCSIGVAVCTEKTATLTDLFKEADDAMYSAKKAGKNQIFTTDQTEHS